MHFRGLFFAGGVLTLMMILAAPAQAQCQGNQRSGGGPGGGRPGSGPPGMMRPPTGGNGPVTSRPSLPPAQFEQLRHLQQQQLVYQQQAIQQYQQQVLAQMSNQSYDNLAWYAVRSQDAYVRWAASAEMARRNSPPTSVAQSPGQR